MFDELRTLFGKIADAIRAKTDETGTMKQAEFAEKIIKVWIAPTERQNEEQNARLDALEKWKKEVDNKLNYAF